MPTRRLLIVAISCLLLLSFGSANAGVQQMRTPVVTQASDADDWRGFFDMRLGRVVADEDRFAVSLVTYDSWNMRQLHDCGPIYVDLPDTNRSIKVVPVGLRVRAVLFSETREVARTPVQHPRPRHLRISFPTARMGPADGLSKWQAIATTNLRKCGHARTWDQLPDMGYVTP